MKATTSKFRLGKHTCYLRPGLIQINKSLQKTTALYFVNNGLFMVTESGGQGHVKQFVSPATNEAHRSGKRTPGVTKGKQISSRVLHLQEQWTLETCMAKEPASPQL